MSARLWLIIRTVSVGQHGMAVLDGFEMLLEAVGGAVACVGGLGLANCVNCTESAQKGAICTFGRDLTLSPSL